MTESDAELGAHLRALEIELQQPAVRADAARLDALLHPEFTEFGRSGTVHSRASMFAHLAAETTPAAIVADDFALRRLGPAVALLNYRSAHRAPDGTLTRHTLRTSIWVHTAAGWQMSFHQGTATDPLA
jgi:hypothetical protein